MWICIARRRLHVPPGSVLPREQPCSHCQQQWWPDATSYPEHLRQQTHLCFIGKYAFDFGIVFSRGEIKSTSHLSNLFIFLLLVPSGHVPALLTPCLTFFYPISQPFLPGTLVVVCPGTVLMYPSSSNSIWPPRNFEAGSWPIAKNRPLTW